MPRKRGTDLPALPDRRRTVLARFEREAKTAARLDHTNATTVYDTAVTEDVCCLVMQIVDGATLDDVVDGADDGRLSVPTAVSVAVQPCSGLSAAHAAGLVHRDLEPQNVMVRTDGPVKVLDFGPVKVLSDDDPQPTTTGETLGNVAHASPELLAEVRALDGRSDLYAVGCLLHHVLTGRPPFDGSGPAEMVTRHLTAPPPRFADHGVDAPAALQHLTHALLAKNPASTRPAARRVLEVATRLRTSAGSMSTTCDDGVHGHTSVPVLEVLPVDFLGVRVHGVGGELGEPVARLDVVRAQALDEVLDLGLLLLDDLPVGGFVRVGSVRRHVCHGAFPPDRSAVGQAARRLTPH
ncbi:serine/threonine-protein kinase [Streptomyces prasinopilosus]|uniref:serine/threonine-protein kinase n=1 Tax=Streptomyces prasinopilosus TaxID=67344 RepID=UPI000AAB87A2|nr:serine/threonine-protein kinase [Streptomyces prasinopilosus]